MQLACQTNQHCLSSLSWSKLIQRLESPGQVILQKWNQPTLAYVSA